MTWVNMRKHFPDEVLEAYFASDDGGAPLDSIPGQAVALKEFLAKLGGLDGEGGSLLEEIDEALVSASRTERRFEFIFRNRSNELA
jgi:hypothetical protein